MKPDKYLLLFPNFVRIASDRLPILLKLLKAFAIYFLLFTVCYSQQPAQEWVARFPDTSAYNAGAYALETDENGNVYVAGGAGNLNFSAYCTVKYSSSGIRQWSAFFYGSNYGGRVEKAIGIDSLHNVYVTGYSNNPSSYFDFCTVKYTSDGIQQWIRYYDAIGGDDEAEKIAVDKAGNVYVSGFSMIGGGNAYVYTTIKYASDGTQLWVRSYGTGGVNTYVNGMVTDQNCNVCITGENDDKSVTIKYDSSGNLLWVRTYVGINGSTSANSIYLDKNSNVYIAGCSAGINTWYDYFTIKYSASGVQQWLKRYNSDSATYSKYQANDICVDNSLNVYVSGFFIPDNTQPPKFCTIKYSTLGDLLWVRKDSDNLVGETTLMSIDKVGNLYVSGTTYVYPNPYSYTVIKYDSSGNQKWTQYYNYPNGDSYLYAVKIDAINNIYLTGTSTGNMMTMKYSQIVGNFIDNQRIPARLELFQNYPNPFNPVTKIRFTIPQYNGKVERIIKLAIYDVLGREVSVLLNQAIKSGTFEINWDASRQSSGIYFCLLSTEDYIDAKTMILLK